MTAHTSAESQSLSMKGTLLVLLHNPDGSVKDRRELRNLIVQVGKNFFASACVAASASPFTHIAIGTSATAPANGDTTLGTETARQTFTNTVTANAVVMTTTFAAGVGTGALQEAGILNAGTAGIMLSHVTFSTVSKGALDPLTVQWTITFG